MLERILSLIPKKPNGDFQHGALKEFAQSVGLKSGNSISDWIAGRSKSYEGYLYQIAAVYNVPVKWLKGETDEQQKSPVQADSPDGEYDTIKESMTPEQRERWLMLGKLIVEGKL